MPDIGPGHWVVMVVVVDQLVMVASSANPRTGLVATELFQQQFMQIVNLGWIETPATWRIRSKWSGMITIVGLD
uniref:Putative secreted protein n=1 Tax=Anopheles darlingi TaxID=43151 RepID=A0A2M4D2L0_ANODA